MNPRMPITLVALLAVLLLPVLGFAQTDSDGYDEATIRPSDVPPDAPRFETYRARSFQGRNAQPRIIGEARRFRTRIQAWSKEKPNFAGHLILATWGCGTGCTQIFLIDAATGRVFEPKGLATNAADNVQDELLQGGDWWHASGSIQFRRDSRLLIVIGMPEEDASRRGISYHVWNGAKLRLVRFVKKAGYLTPAS